MTDKKTYHASLKSFPKKPVAIAGKLQEMLMQIQQYDKQATLDKVKNLVVFAGDEKAAESLRRLYNVEAAIETAMPAEQIPQPLAVADVVGTFRN